MPRTTLLPRRRPRTPSRRERAVGWSLLAILAGLVAFFVLSRTLLPAPAGLPETAAPPSGPESVFPALSPGGWTRGKVESYDRETVFEKINGKADAYLLYRFASLAFAGYERPTGDGAFVDVYLYDMETPLDGFGIYRAQRSGAEADAGVGEESCAEGEALFARKGRYYFEVYASGPEAAAEAHAVARAVASNLPAPETPARVPSSLPADGLRVANFFRTSALGVEALRDVFLGIYDDGTTIVLGRYASAAEAEAAAAQARDEIPFLGMEATFVTRGSALVGVVGLPDAAARSARAEEVLAAWQEEGE